MIVVGVDVVIVGVGEGVMVDFICRFVDGCLGMVVVNVFFLLLRLWMGGSLWNGLVGVMDVVGGLGCDVCGVGLVVCLIGVLFGSGWVFGVVDCMLGMGVVFFIFFRCIFVMFFLGMFFF